MIVLAGIRRLLNVRMNRYDRVQNDLETQGFAQMKCHGNSMIPILESGTLNTYQTEDEYRVGDIVLCKVRGNFIDAHLIKAIGDRGYLIANNHGRENGWTRTIIARVVFAEFGDTIRQFVDDRPLRAPEPAS